MASPARTRSDQRSPVDLERFWNVRNGHCITATLVHAEFGSQRIPAARTGLHRSDAAGDRLLRRREKPVHDANKGQSGRTPVPVIGAIAEALPLANSAGQRPISAARWRT
jgi:hypothetical protein